MRMEIRFMWMEDNGRHEPICAGYGSIDRYDYLGCLLTDDGGLGRDFHLPWLREARRMCGKILDGVSESECFTTECFAADMSADGVWISFNTEEPTSGARLLFPGFIRVLDDWIDFLEAGPRNDGASVTIHADL